MPEHVRHSLQLLNILYRLVCHKISKAKEMGKAGIWFAALKKAFTSSSKEKPIHVSEKKNVKEKKRWGFGRSKHGETNSFIPLYREPSSIEKILGEAEKEQHHKLHQAPSTRVQRKISGDAEREQQYKTHQAPSPKVQQKISGDAEREQHHKTPQTPPRKVPQFKTPSPKQVLTPKYTRAVNLDYVHISAIKIQAAFRGYMARRSYRALKGLMRLQDVMRGPSVKRQTMNAMKCMQMLVRVQSQIRARRLQMMENRGLQQHLHTPRRSDKDQESNFGKWSITHQSVAETTEEWDDSVLTKEEADARMRRKVGAVIKRERALAYAYTHQLLKVTPKSAAAALTDIRTGGFPRWWNWLERQIPPETHIPLLSRPDPIPQAATPTSSSATAAAAHLRPHSRPVSRGRPSRPDPLDIPTPRSATSSYLQRHHQLKPAAAAAAAAAGVGLRDDESLTSCPAFAARPNYMAPTASAKAKVRAPPAAGGVESKRRFVFGFGHSIGSLFATAKESGGAQGPGKRNGGKHRKTVSVGGLSVDSTLSLPVGLGRGPSSRYV